MEKPFTRRLSGQKTSEPTIKYLLTVFDSGHIQSALLNGNMFNGHRFIALNAGEENDQIWWFLSQKYLGLKQ